MKRTAFGLTIFLLAAICSTAYAAGELAHKDAGTHLSTVEYHATDAHSLDSQAAGDIIYAEDGSTLVRLAAGTNGYFLTLSGGMPAWVENAGGGVYRDGETYEEMLDETLNKGRLHAITISDNGGTSITWTVSEFLDTSGEVPSIVNTLVGGEQAAEGMNYLFYDPTTTETLDLRTTRSTGTGIEVAAIAVLAGDVVGILTWEAIKDREAAIADGLMRAFPVIVITGVEVTENVGGLALDVSVGAGQFEHGAQHLHEPGAIDTVTSPLLRVFHHGSDWATSASAQIDPTQYDTGTTLAATTANKYYRSAFKHGETVIYWAYPTTAYNTIAAAIGGVNPVFPESLDIWPCMTAVIMRGDDTTFPTAGGERWIDCRPIPGVESSGSVESHNSLAGLQGGAADDYYHSTAAQIAALHVAVTLAGTPNYITLAGQVITRGLIVLTTDVSGVLPEANISAELPRLAGHETITGGWTFLADVTIDTPGDDTGPLVVSGFTSPTAANGTYYRDGIQDSHPRWKDASGVYSIYWDSSAYFLWGAGVEALAAHDPEPIGVYDVNPTGGGTPTTMTVIYNTTAIRFIGPGDDEVLVSVDSSGDLNIVPQTGDDIVLDANTTVTGTLNVTGGVIEDTDAEDLVLRANGNANQLVLDSGGDVGIGTAAPDATLHIKDAVAKITIEPTDGSARDYDIYADGGSMYIQGTGSSGVLNIGEDGTAAVAIDLGAPANSIKVDSTGFVGIDGVNAPAVSLHVGAANTTTTVRISDGSLTWEDGDSHFLFSHEINAPGWSSGSSIDLKTSVTGVSAQDALADLDGLTPVSFIYKDALARWRDEDTTWTFQAAPLIANGSSALEIEGALGLRPTYPEKRWGFIAQNLPPRLRRRTLVVDWQRVIVNNTAALKKAKSVILEQRDEIDTLTEWKAEAIEQRAQDRAAFLALRDRVEALESAP